MQGRDRPPGVSSNDQETHLEKGSWDTIGRCEWALHPSSTSSSGRRLNTSIYGTLITGCEHEYVVEAKIRLSANFGIRFDNTPTTSSRTQTWSVQVFIYSVKLYSYLCIHNQVARRPKRIARRR